MKKAYKTPTTTTVQLLATNTIMAGSTGAMFISVHETGGEAPTGSMQ